MLDCRIKLPPFSSCKHLLKTISPRRFTGVSKNTKQHFLRFIICFQCISLSTSPSFGKNALKLTQVVKEVVTGIHLHYFSHRGALKMFQMLAIVVAGMNMPWMGVFSKISLTIILDSRVVQKLENTDSLGVIK